MSHEDVNPIFKKEGCSELINFFYEKEQYVSFLKEKFDVKLNGLPFISTVNYRDYKSIYNKAENIAWVFCFEVWKGKYSDAVPLTVHMLVLTPPNVCIYGEELFSNREHREKIFERASEDKKPYQTVTIPGNDPYLVRFGSRPNSLLFIYFAKNAHLQNSSFHYYPFKITYAYPSKNFTISFPLKKYFFQSGSYQLPLFNNKTCFFKPPPRYSKEYESYKHGYVGFPYETSTLYVGEKPQKIMLSRESLRVNGTKKNDRTIFYIVPISKKIRLE